jgi:ATP-dependent Lon protease
MSQTPERIGLATGLAWTEIGGDVLEVETSILSGKGGLTLTGQLGEVMQESAQAAMSYIRSRAKDLGLKQNFYSSNDIHLHIPEGATPKDGPSAGITIGTALVSALTNNPTKPNLAMTGEITLQGRILSIGGLKEKLLAAKQHNCTTIIVPKENADDLEDIKKEMSLENLNINFVSNMDEVLKIAFAKDPFDKKTFARKSVSEGKRSMKKKPTRKKAKEKTA